MEPDFWHDKWTRNEIGFHQSKPNALLERHFEKLSLTAGQRVFLPLCGKTLDIGWLLSQGYRVAGAELSEAAIEQLFDELGRTPDIYDLGALKHFHAKGIDIFVGDILELTADMLGPVDGIYDRAALVALPADMRGPYTQHLMDVTKTAPQLLLCFEYDQNAMNGPPFSIDGPEVTQHYQEYYDITRLECSELQGGLKGRVAADEIAWLLDTR
ncbi:MAG: thiopurine S-methyltransferase [Sneathiella sp.]